MSVTELRRGELFLLAMILLHHHLILCNPHLILNILGRTAVPATKNYRSIRH